jgi:hypothetical protein
MVEMRLLLSVLTHIHISLEQDRSAKSKREGSQSLQARQAAEEALADCSDRIAIQVPA